MLHACTHPDTELFIFEKREPVPLFGKTNLPRGVHAAVANDFLLLSFVLPFWLQHPYSQVNVGKQLSSSKDSVGKAEGRGGLVADGERSAQRTLGVSLLGACSSKGCPTKSVENEDRYVHVRGATCAKKSRGLGGAGNLHTHECIERLPLLGYGCCGVRWPC